MVKYIIWRLLWLIPVIIGITFFIFVVMELSPGNPVLMILGPDPTQEEVTAKTIELGLDKPFLIRYLTYIFDMLKGDFGFSWVKGFNVLQEFLVRLPKTFSIALLSVLVMAVISVPLGTISALRQYGVFDSVATVISLIFCSMPSFLFGLILQIIFAINLGWLPSSGLETAKYLILPVATVSCGTVANQMRLVRSAMLEMLEKDFIRTARAKGAKEIRVVVVHMLRNAMLPIITSFGSEFVRLIGGAAVLEAVFSIAGIGTLMLNAVQTHDIPVIMGVLTFVAVIVGLCNFIVDMCYAIIDPRVRAGYTSRRAQQPFWRKVKTDE